MATLTARAGNKASVKKGNSVILGMGSWKMDGITTELLDTTSFGDTAKTFITGMLDYGTITFSGFYDPADTTGQNALITANAANTKLTDVKLFINSTSGWVPDLTTDSGSGLYVTSWSIGFDKSGLGTIDFSAKASGPWVLV